MKSLGPAILLTVGSAFGATMYYCPSKAASCASNNGNLKTVTLTVPNVDQNFTYDNLNRLSSAAEGDVGAPWNGKWSQTYGYDNYGNRWVSASTGLGVDPFMPTVATNFNLLNRLDVMSSEYDAAGNQKKIGGFDFVSDAESRLVSSTQLGVTTTFGYDGMGKRVTKEKGGLRTTFVYDAMGRLAEDYGGPQMPCVTCYLAVDHLGSTRALTDGTAGSAAFGAVVERHDFLPFGEDIYAEVGSRTEGLKYLVMNGLPDTLGQKFTGKERDAETGLDYFGARYFSGAQGRFTSPDAPFADQHPEDPQSWNLYGYSRNNPLRYVDPTGQYICGSNVTQSQCDNFQESLNAAQTQADTLKEKYGADSKQYMAAQRAIDAYGTQGFDNGVLVRIGSTSKWGGYTSVSGTVVAKTRDNPTGQDIAVTLPASAFSGKGNATAWVNRARRIARCGWFRLDSIWSEGFADELPNRVRRVSRHGRSCSSFGPPVVFNLDRPNGSYKYSP